MNKPMTPLATTNAQATKLCQNIATEHDTTLAELMDTFGYGSQKVSLCRAYCMYELREQMGWTWERIGDFFEKSHGTALKAHKRISKLLTKDGDTASQIVDLVMNSSWTIDYAKHPHCDKTRKTYREFMASKVRNIIKQNDKCLANQPAPQMPEKHK